jgi:predicted ATPase
MINPILFRKIIVITGGPCGGKTTLIDELCKNALYNDMFVTLPESVFYVLQTGTSTKEKLFQQVMVEVQAAMENVLDRCFEHNKIILCHRGTLDPLAYWLNNGWDEKDFFSYTHTTLKEHFNRYHAVIHLQTAGAKAVNYYQFYPDAHRHENPNQAMQIDTLLAYVWKEHLNYYFIESNADWEIKRDKFFSLINSILI